MFVSPSGAKLPRAARQGRGNKQHSVSTDPLCPAARLTTFTPAPANRKKNLNCSDQRKAFLAFLLRFCHCPWEPAGSANQRGLPPPKKIPPAISSPAQRPRPTTHCRNVFDSRTSLVSNLLRVKTIVTNCNHASCLCGIYCSWGTGGGALGCEPMRRQFVTMCD